MSVDNNKTTQKNKERKLTIKEKAFCREYAKTGNSCESVFKAGYKAKDTNSASTIASRLLHRVTVQEEINRLLNQKEKKAIMDAQEVMELYSAIARGEVKDQFGLEASLNDRLKAMSELAKRTVDIENRTKGTPDAVVNIKLDWSRKKD